MDPSEIKKLKNKIRMLRATLLVRNGVYPGKIYHIMYDDDTKQWAVKLDSNKNLVFHKDKNDAIRKAKKWAKKAYIGQVFIYKKDGTPQKVHTYVDEVGKERERARRREAERRRRNRIFGWY